MQPGRPRDRTIGVEVPVVPKRIRHIRRRVDSLCPSEPIELAARRKEGRGADKCVARGFPEKLLRRVQWPDGIVLLGQQNQPAEVNAIEGPLEAAPVHVHDGEVTPLERPGAAEKMGLWADPFHVGSIESRLELVVVDEDLGLWALP